MQYQLNVVIDDTGLQYIYSSGQSVILVRSVASKPAPTMPSTVVWVTFAPFEQNQITWNDTSYAIYAAASQNGVTVSMVTPIPTQPGLIYNFQDGGITTNAGSGAAYIALNQLTLPNFLFGMQQAASINNLPVTSNLNAAPVGLQQQISQTPAPSVSIFLAAGLQNGETISGIPNNALTVDLTSGSATVAFDDESKSFIQQQSQAQTAGVEASV